METEFDVNKIIASGVQNELDFERASIIHRLLRLMVKENSKLEPMRKNWVMLLEFMKTKIGLEILI